MDNLDTRLDSVYINHSTDRCTVLSLKALPSDKFLHSTKLEAFADDIFNVVKNDDFCLK